MEKEVLSLTIIEDEAKVFSRQTDIQRQEDALSQNHAVIGFEQMMSVVGIKESDVQLHTC